MDSVECQSLLVFTIFKNHTRRLRNGKFWKQVRVCDDDYSWHNLFVVVLYTVRDGAKSFVFLPTHDISQ